MLLQCMKKKPLKCRRIYANSNKAKMTACEFMYCPSFALVPQYNNKTEK